MTLFSRHLDAGALGRVVLDGRAGPRTSAHLASCPRCRRERDRIAVLLSDARAGADDVVDGAFSAAALQRQRQAVLHRIAKSDGVARILRFPHGPGRPATATRPDARWLLVAAAAGLLLGVAAGQLPHLFTAAGKTPDVARAVAPAVLVPAPDWRIDDTLLRDVDAALDGHARPELEALDALTPVHYEAR